MTSTQRIHLPSDSSIGKTNCVKVCRSNCSRVILQAEHRIKSCFKTSRAQLWREYFTKPGAHAQHMVACLGDLVTSWSSSGSSGAADNCRRTVLVPLSAVYKAWQGYHRAVFFSLSFSPFLSLSLPSPSGSAFCKVLLVDYVMCKGWFATPTKVGDYPTYWYRFLRLYRVVFVNGPAQKVLSVEDGKFPTKKMNVGVKPHIVQSHSSNLTFFGREFVIPNT